ncbi:Lsr2 protein [Nakamurella panacisegetis]|uniref:Lsr2 protein n=1 Tax=Nakamurella panacisegetis TaxID=1090615 RepID=A0A1H0MCS9_9ACTN|nr:Lsr2 family protein [Nakamurella panacisegetis]SDO77970.1 Lsr2 protein [Nakamurella panacisegetis]
MAQVTNVKLLDDLDGSKAVETISFGIDGVGYEIDLNLKNAKALRKAMAEFVAAGRHLKVPAAGSAARSTSRSRSAGPDAAVIRQWANENGVPVSVRGRVSADVRAQYMAATGQ